MKTFICNGLLGLLALCGANAPSWSQEYPTKPIRFVAPWPPGIEADARLRALTAKLQERLGWVPVIDNKPGGNFVIAPQAVIQAPADGYTVLVAITTMTIIPHTQRDLSFDFFKDLVPVTRFLSFPLAIIANPSFPAKSLKDLVAYSRANPGKVSYGTTGSGGPNHLSAELLKRAAGIDMTNIPYKASNQLFTDVMSGVVPLIVTGPTELSGQIRAGKLRILALLSLRRSSVFPDAPTAAESGLPGTDLEVDSWMGFMFRSGTPKEIVGRFHREMVSVLQLPEMREQFLKLGGIEPMSETPEEFGRKLVAEHARWGRVLREANINVR